MGAGGWNRHRYTLWSPVYDLVVRFLRSARTRVHGLLEAKAGQRVLIVGAGTGEDLPLLPADTSVVATDINPSMLARAARKTRPGQELRLMDGQALEFPAESFDLVLLHLVLAVVPDPVKCLAEAARVVRRGGRISVFDKFLPDRVPPSGTRRLLNAFTRFVATDINRSFEDILRRAQVPLRVDVDVPLGLGGAYRAIILTKEEGPLGDPA